MRILQGLGLFLIGFPRIFHRTITGFQDLMAPHYTNMKTPALVFTPIGPPLSIILGAGKVLSYLVNNALYWAELFHIDGLRVDAVASMLYRDYSRKAGEWLPNDEGGRENWEAVNFLQTTNRELRENAKGFLTIAEESTSWPGVTHQGNRQALGFNFKWNMGFMNDTLRYMSRDPIHRPISS